MFKDQDLGKSLWLGVWKIMNAPARWWTTKFDYKDIYNDIFTKLIINEMKEKISLPICIQVAGLPLTDENVLSLMKEIDANYRFDLVDINNWLN